MLVERFSLGMDEIAAKLEKMGIVTTVTSYLDWQALVNQAAAEYKSAGSVGTIILVGHSSGAIDADGRAFERTWRVRQIGYWLRSGLARDGHRKYRPLQVGDPLLSLLRDLKVTQASTI